MAKPAEPQRFQNLFENPTVSSMYALSPKEFEKFVAYVFRRAGYDVHDVAFKFTKGVDLELLAPGDRRKRLGGVEVKRFEPGTSVNAATVQKLMGAPAVRGSTTRAYLATTAGFNKAAYEFAKHGKGAHLINGEQLCRYIRYIKGSRYDDRDGTRVILSPDLFSGENTIARCGVHHAKILTIANNKGGVGKTTTARYIAKGLAARGKQVLLIDMDAQGNLTESFLDVSSSAVPGTHLAGYFARQYPLDQLARATHTHNVELIPAHPNLSLVDTGGAGRPDVEMQFRADVYSAFGQPTPTRPQPFDWIVLDTPPAISLFTRSALGAADYVIAPARCRPSSLAGIRNMLNTLETMSALMGSQPRLLGCLVTHWGEDEHSRDTYTRLVELFDNRRSSVLNTKIPLDVTIEKPLGSTHHRASDAYDEALEEVLASVDNR